MKLTGILDNSLNGQLCLRGFANIKELANNSTADYSYQRNLIKRTDIVDFLETQEYLFFPEVILSYKFQHKFAKKKEVPLKSIQVGQSYRSNVNGDSISIQNLIANGKNNLPKNIRVATLNVPNITGVGKPFHRIDGNHRLAAAEQLDSDKIRTMIVPFCILLGTDYYNENGEIISHEESKIFDKATKIFFYNINSKTIPLTSEENLKVMIDDPTNFPDNELKEIFGGEYPIYTRQLINKIAINQLIGTKHLLKGQIRTICNEIFKRVLETSDEVDMNKLINSVYSAIHYVDKLYQDTPELSKNKSFDLFFSFLWYGMKDKDTFEHFTKWILTNKLYDANETLIDLYEKTRQQDIKVFVAMPFYGKDEIKSANNIYKRIFQELSQRYHINIHLNGTIMKHEGETFNMTMDIFDRIQKSDICICDITDNNPNVMCEFGLAKGYGLHVILVKEEQSPKASFDIDQFYHDTFKKTASSTLEDAIKTNVLKVLSDHYNIITEEK